MRFSFQSFVALLGLFLVLPGDAAELAVNSLSGPPEDFENSRMPRLSETLSSSNFLMLENKHTHVDGRGLDIAPSGSFTSSFQVNQDTGFTLIQVSSIFPVFSSFSITSPEGKQFNFDGTSSLTCAGGSCGEYEANLNMESFSAGGGAAAISVSGGEVHQSGIWSLTETYPTQQVSKKSSESTLQFDSMIAYDNSTVDAGIDPPCERCLEKCEGFCPEPRYDLVEGGTPTLALSFSTEDERATVSTETTESGPGERARRLRESSTLTKLKVEITNTETKTVWHSNHYDGEGRRSLKKNPQGFHQVPLPPMQTGVHSVRVDAALEVDGVGVVERTVIYPIAILPKTYHLNGLVTSQVLDHDRLQIDLGLESDADEHAMLYAYAEVWSKTQEKPIAWIGGMTHPVADDSGVLSLPMVFDTRWLALSETTGDSLLLRNVRIQDTDTYVPYVQVEELELPVESLPQHRSVLSAEKVSVDDTLYFGKGDITVPVPDLPVDDIGLRRRLQATPDGIVLVHGWCSNPAWPAFHFNDGPTRVFSDPGQSRSHSNFAQRIRTFGDSQFNTEWAVVAHSQGGAAATHMRAHFPSLLDASTAPRPIQTMGTPYGGSTLMDLYVGIGGIWGFILAEIFGFCGPQLDLTTVGSALWRTSIPSSARSDVFYFRTRHRRPSNFWQRLQFWRWRCNIASFIIPSSDDGVVAHWQGTLSNANNMGIVDEECHVGGMNHPDQKDTLARNQVMDFMGRPPPPVPLTASCFIDWEGPFCCDQNGDQYWNQWADASNSIAGAFPIATFTWTISGSTGSPTTNDRVGPFMPGLPGQAQTYWVSVTVTDTSGATDDVTCPPIICPIC